MNSAAGRRGQFEIMGLAIFIVIVILGATFFLVVRTPDKAAFADEYETQQLAQSIIDVYLKTDVGDTCPGVTMYDLVRDATIGTNDLCESGTTKKSDVLLNETAKKAVEAATGYPYSFNIQVDTEAPVVKVPGCTGRGARNIIAGVQDIRLLPLDKTATLTVQLCPTR